MLGYPAVFLGSSPSRAPSMYHLMSRLDLGDRVLYPQGGFTRLIEVIAALAERHGARLHTGTTVTGILTERRPRGGRPRVTGVEHDGGRRRPPYPPGRRGRRCRGPAPPRDRAAPRRAADPPAAGVAAPLTRARAPCSRCSAWRGGCPQLAHHSLFFTSDWDRNFGDIFGPDARVPDPASIYVCKPSASDPTVAPDGCENLFVLVPVPADVAIGSGGDDGQGSEAVERAADAAIDQVAAWAGVPDLRDRIRVRHTVGPEDFARRYNAWRGGALGLEHTLRQSAFLRPGNASSKVDGLLYAGASTVPGVGLPMCLISAELVLKRLTGRPVGAAGARPDEPAALVVRRHAGLLPGRDAAAGPRPSGSGCCGSRGGCCSPSSRPGRRSWSGTSTPPRQDTGGSTPPRRCPGGWPGSPSRRSPSSSSSRWSSVLTYEAVRVVRRRDRPGPPRRARGGPMTYTALAVVAVAGGGRAGPLGGAHPADHARATWWAAYGIIVVFQLLTNGWLTGRRIVRYDPDAIIGNDRVTLVGDGRLVYAPVEDLGFGFALVLTTCVVWVWLGRRSGEEGA